jgi:pyruvate kinase
VAQLRDIDDMAALTERRLLEEGLVRKGDLVGIVGGTPLGIGGTTNFMKFHIVGGGEQVWR